MKKMPNKNYFICVFCGGKATKGSMQFPVCKKCFKEKYHDSYDEYVGETVKQNEVQTRGQSEVSTKNKRMDSDNRMKPKWVCPYSSKCIVGGEDYCYEPKEVVECYLYQYYEETEMEGKSEENRRLSSEKEGWDRE